MEAHNANNLGDYWLPVQESYGLGVKTVEKPFCPRLGTLGTTCHDVVERTIYDWGGWGY